MSQPKEWVKARYGAIAKQAKGSCCGEATDCGGDSAATTAELIGYDAADVAAVPDGANLGLGCGNPLALASIKPGETVLDLGSGAGFDAFLAAAQVGSTGRVIGVDLTPEMVEQAKANARKGGYTNVEFLLGDIEAMPVDSNSVDLVISNCVLNLVPDKAKAFREIYRVLKPGGRFAISDIVLDKPLPPALRDSEAAYCSCVSGAMNRKEYLGLLQEAGLVDLTVESEVDAATLLGQDCCEAGLVPEELLGTATSIHLTAHKPIT